MHIITRNFFRLLRAGVFGQQDKVEPMSVWKWNRLFLLATLHGVEAEAYEGLEVLSDQFFVQIIPSEQRSQWAAMAVDARHSRPAPEKGEAASVEEALAEGMQRLSQALLTDHFWVGELLALGEQIREKSSAVHRDQLKKLISKIHLRKMSQLEGALLVQLMGLQPEELPFDIRKDTKAMEPLVDAIATAIPRGQLQLKFTQGNHIFVSANNTSGVKQHLRRSVRFMPFCPKDSILNIYTTFARSLTNIEE